MAMKNSFSEKKFLKLHKAVKWCIKELEHPRAERISAVKQFVGGRYGSGGTDKNVPVDFLKLAVDIYVRQLSPSMPRVLITTHNEDLMAIAANETLAVNQIPEEINLSRTLKKFVTEALFSIGIVKVGLFATRQVAGQDYGEPFVDVVTLDDFFYDMSAKSEDAIQFEGNDYWLPFDDIKNADWVDKDVMKDLKADEYTMSGVSGENRASEISSSGPPEQYRDRILLRDVFLKDEQIIVTYAVQAEKLLKVTKWNGPKNGPYHKLGFTIVPGNLRPLAPVPIWQDLHELANTVFRKLGRQAVAQKNVAAFLGGDDESVRNLKNAEDGDGIAYNGQPPVDLKVGGIDQTNLAFFMQCRDLFSYFAGNIDSLGGLSPMTDTVGQDKLLGEAASAMLRDMSDETIKVIRDIFKSLAWYEWRDPVKTRTLKKPIAGTDEEISVPWGQKQRSGDFEDFALEVDVFSMQDNSPSIKLQKLGMIMERYIAPLMPMIKEQGGTIDAQAIIKIVTKYSNMPELSEVVQFVQADGEQASAAEGGGRSADSKHTYERISRPGASAGGKSQILQAAALGGKPQASEMASLERPTG